MNKVILNFQVFISKVQNVIRNKIKNRKILKVLILAQKMSTCFETFVKYVKCIINI